MIYHYTDRDSAQDIIKAGKLEPYPILISTELLGGDEVELAKAVWFTLSEKPSQTVLAKMTLGGWLLDRPGMIWRFGVAAETAPLDLPTWAHPYNYPPEMFRWMLLTAHLAGENWEDWRLTGESVTKDLWGAVQSLHGNTWENEIF